VATLHPATFGQAECSIDALNRAFEAATLLVASEAGFARDYYPGALLDSEWNRLRLEAFALGAFDGVARSLPKDCGALPLLVFLQALIDCGPGERARQATTRHLALGERTELIRYVAGGRTMVQRLQAGAPMPPGHFARLLETGSLLED
jgi:hypothetical protein